MALSLISDPEPCIEEKETPDFDPGAVSIYFPGRELLTKQGVYVDGMFHVEPGERNYGVYGPYVTMRPGLYEVSFLFEVGSPCSGVIEIDFARNKGVKYATKSVDLENAVDQEGKLDFFLNLQGVSEHGEFRISSGEATYIFRACIVRRISTSQLPPILVD